MLECFLVFIFEKQLKSTIVYVPTIFFLIIMTIHITARKCTVSKTKTKNTEKYTIICETKSKKKHYFNCYIGKWTLGEPKSSRLIYGSKVKEKKSELRWYNNGPQKLSVSKTHLIQDL